VVLITNGSVAQLGEVFMKLTEIFDTDVAIHWQRNGRFELGGIVFSGHEYIIQIETKPLMFNELLGRKTAEVSFFRNTEDSEAAHSTTGDIKQPFALYGSVASGLLKRFQDFDAFYFAAESRHSSSNDQFISKTNIYNFLADQLTKRVGARKYEKIDNDCHMWLISKYEITYPGFVVESVVALNMFNSSNPIFTVVK
jgi:hypothetical protein